MGNLIDIISDYYPPNGGINLPLRSLITITFDRLMDTNRLQEDFFLEGPDTDQYVGPGLLELRVPDNVSQGDLDDFLRSPGMKGLVEGTFEFDEPVSGVNTRMTFVPTRPLAATFKYTAHLLETLDKQGELYTGSVIWEFETGTPVIQSLPSSASTSVLADAISSSVLETSTNVLSELHVLGTTPVDHAIEQSTELKEIVVEFNRPLDPDIDPENVLVTTLPVTDHPNANVRVLGRLAKHLEVIGRMLHIHI